MGYYYWVRWVGILCLYSKADSRFATSWLQTSLQRTAVSRWLGPNLESALYSLCVTGGLQFIVTSRWDMATKYLSFALVIFSRKLQGILQNKNILCIYLQHTSPRVRFRSNTTCQSPYRLQRPGDWWTGTNQRHHRAAQARAIGVLPSQYGTTCSAFTYVHHLGAWLCECDS